jgi:hypothetical protein
MSEGQGVAEDYWNGTAHALLSQSLSFCGCLHRREPGDRLRWSESRCQDRAVDDTISGAARDDTM